MLQVEERKRVSRIPAQNEFHARRIVINQVAFSIGTLVVQLHKYSAYLLDGINLQAKFSDYGQTNTVQLEYAPSIHQTFTSLYKQIEMDIEEALEPITNVKNIKVDLEWFTGQPGDNGVLKCQINARKNNDFNDVRFFSEPGSIFHTVFNKADVHFNTIAGSIRYNPPCLLRDIDCFSGEELEEIQSVAYGPVLSGTENTQLHNLFERVVEQYPFQAAIHFEGKSLSYHYLNVKSNRLAHTLIKMGVAPGDFVGILLDRSPEAYIAIIGVLKAGAAYVPMDPDHPTDRIQFILNDSGAKILISSGHHKEKYSTFAGHVVIVSGGLNNYATLVQLHSRQDENPDLVVNPRSPAYMIYTSGTTGIPKGVVIPHAAVANLVMAEREIFNLSSGDKVLQGFSLAFDASIEEIWLALLRGATLVPASKALMCSGEDLSNFIDKEEITVLSTVPTLLSTMRLNLSSLRILILGGEAAPQQLLQRWHRKGLRIVNTYGPTEATVIATYADFQPGEKITIGKPIQNYAAFITNESMELLPKGVPGELCLAGNGLATGYLNRAELTAKKFISPAFGLSDHFNHNHRVYRTGDLAMYNAKGQIEFLGRIDSQVKLRGYRIELSEIESRLLQYDNIQNAAVAVKSDEHSVERLVAYIILKDNSLFFDEGNCKKFLSASLAPYMIPALFMELPEFPVLASGKVDRKKLPEPKNNVGAARPLVAPRNKHEEQIYSIWKKYFAPHEVSVTDNFFLDLGGHSLLAARMVSELRQINGFRQVSVLDVYKHPTVERLSKELTSRPILESEQSNDHQRSEQVRYIPSRLKHFFCGVLQFLSLYFVFGFNTVMGASGYLVYFFFSLNGHSWIESAAWALSSTVVAYPAVVFIAIALKWILLGRIQPGKYKLWGWFYFRWWLVQNLVQVIGFGHFAGTPILPFLYRLLGVKIGKDVHIETDHLGAYDLISIDDGSSIDQDVKLLGYSVKDGYLSISTIDIGKRCFVGERSVLLESTILEDNARLEDLSLLPAGSKVPSGETWEGSPAQFKHAITVADEPLTLTGIRRLGVTLLYIVLIFVIPVISFISFIPGIAILFQFNLFEAPLTYLAMLPVVGATFVLLLTLESVIFKWILVGRVRPGKYPVHGSFYIRNWIVEKLLKLSLDYAGQLHATLHVAHWYRALGMKVGKMVELSTAVTATPDLVSLSDESTIADEVSLGSPQIERGWMNVSPVKLGRRAFVGNSGVVPSGREMGDGSLVGVLSIAPNAQNSKQSNATWFGSPSILFPKRETSSAFTEEKTYRPSRWLRFKRGTFELLRITLPPTGFILVTVAMINFALSFWEVIGLAATLAMLPIIFAVSSLCVILIAALLKWLVIGRYKPFVKPLWSNFVWRLEFVNALYEFLSAPLLLQSLQGTPFLPWYLRLLGSKIGNMCYIDTTGFLEWDMINIGDRAAIGEDAVMQTHLFEDRILKASPFNIGADCSVGAGSVVLYDTTMHDGSHLDALSLLMKGETLQAKTHWRGIPALSTV
jgi:non-ribosomal peptide synthetase-like protein